MITLQFTQEELQSLVGLLDAGVRATGIRAVKDAASLLDKLENAQEDQPDADDHD